MGRGYAGRAGLGGLGGGFVMCYAMAVFDGGACGLVCWLCVVDGIG